MVSIDVTVMAELYKGFTSLWGVTKVQEAFISHDVKAEAKAYKSGFQKQIQDYI